MKKNKQICGLLALSLMFTLFLSACAREKQIVGTWIGNGDLDIFSVEAPFEFANQIEFKKDGTATVTIGSERIEFSYSMTSDTLTLNNGETSWGLLFQLKGNILTIETGGSSSATLTRAS